MTGSKLHSIADLLPHRGPMLLLDSVLQRDSEGITTRCVPHARMPFFIPDRGMPAHAALEWMAQTCGAFVGAQAVDAGRKPRIGFLLGSRNFQCHVEWFSVGMALDIWAKLLFLDGNMGVFDCGIRAGPGADYPILETGLAIARLTVYQPPENELGQTIAEK